MKKLYIDTSSNEYIVVTLFLDNVEKKYDVKMDRKRSQGLLPLIQQALDENDILFNDLEKIEVNCGPGSYTGLRVGVTIANTLATVLNIPINDLPVGQLAEPIYS